MDHPAFTGPELCALSAAEAVDLLRRKEIAPIELIRASRTRVAAVDGAVNAMPTRCWDRAEAAAATLEGDAYHPGWLAGLPIGIKDLTAVEGVRTTWGTKALADFVPPASDDIVQRLEGRGGVVVGKTNTPEFGAGGNTFNDVFGPTRNPWDTRLNAGGSSGGAAAGLATGQVWLSQGSDLGGSLRTPAAFCGVVGFRPGPGIAGGGPAGHRFHGEGVSGPMARSVEDCALFLDAMAGFDVKNPISFPAPEIPYRDAVRRAEGTIRIAFSPDLGGFGRTSKEMEADLRRALDRIARDGHVVDEACPSLPQLDKTYRVLRAMLWAALPGRAPDAVQQHYKATLRENIAFGRGLTIDDVLDAQLNRSAIFDSVVGFLDDFDVLAFPVVGLHPGPIEIEYPAEINGSRLDDYISWLEYSFLSTTTGLPSVSVPVGFNAEGMPVGLQLLGRHRGEADLLAAARAVEIAMGGPNGPIDPKVTHQ